MNDEKLIEFISGFFTDRGKQVPSNDSDLFELSIIDSMDLLELVLQLESELDVRIQQELMTADNFRSINSIVSVVRR